MLVDANPSSSAASVTGAIQKAASLTGTSFQYLLATAKVESNLNPKAAARTSTAGGLFQFIEQTWFGTLKEAGASFGYDRYAAAISQTASGRYVVSDPALRAEILKLREDPTANALMAGALTRSNAAVLQRKLGRAPNEGELYIAHFLGANGAARLIGQAQANPRATAAELFPNAAKANRSIFFDRSGRARNFGEVSATLAGRYQVALGNSPVVPPAQAAPVAETVRVARAYQAAAPLDRMPVASASAVSVPAAPPRAAPVPMLQAAAAPATAASANATPVGADAAAVAEEGYAFRNPYRLAERTQPVAPAVGDLWSQAAANVARVRAMAAAADTGVRAPVRPSAPDSLPVRKPPTVADTQAVRTAQAGAEPLGLFQDFRPNVRALFGGG